MIWRFKFVLVSTNLNSKNTNLYSKSMSSYLGVREVRIRTRGYKFVSVNKRICNNDKEVIPNVRHTAMTTYVGKFTAMQQFESTFP